MEQGAVSFGGLPIIRFLDTPAHPDLQRWAAEGMELLRGTGFDVWIDLPVFFITTEMMSFVGATGDAVGVLDRVADNLVPAYSGTPPLPDAVYDELDQAGGVLAIGLNIEIVAADDDPEYAIKSTLLHEVAHAVHEAAPTEAKQMWDSRFAELRAVWGDDWWTEHLFRHGPVEAFAELFAKQLLDEWHGPPQVEVGRAFAALLPAFSS